jgi:phosphocarrier protein HPr
MEKRILTVTNELGIHARPSKHLVITATKFKSEISLKKEDQIANVKSILELLTLAAECGTVLELISNGEDEAQAADAIEEIFKNNFFECYNP